MEAVEKTIIWKNSLKARKTDPFPQERERLRSEFFKFRKRAGILVAQIAKAFPNLTVHDITHLDRLWEIASLVAGPKYPINPLEAFVLGGAFLLHDAGLCFEAYEGGLQAVRQTIDWKDAISAEKSRATGQNESDQESVADFVTLRNIHARQAEHIVEKSWIDPDTKQPRFLIEDFEIRKHLGGLIGKLAASHNSSIEEVADNFRDQVNSFAGFPTEWRIDPIKLACLLRCADALHIDSFRAPDFLHALLHRKGASFNHWQAQNWLARPDLDQSDDLESTVIITSTRPFEEQNAESWWVAFDAITLADKEIRSANALLESRSFKHTAPPFRVRRIKGIESPERLARFVEAKGWTPCTAEIHVGNVESLVRTLGGEQLYNGSGAPLGVALRELIQNARDAVRARETLEANFKGKILIRYLPSKRAISVEDNGVGMSRRVLTGPLLDFGTSFWSSSLVNSEFPGLRSSRFRPVGQFGIGFYSVFMVADRVEVSTRRWVDGLDSLQYLRFENSVMLRPLLKSGRLQDFPSTMSTRVVFYLKPEIQFDPGNLEMKFNAIHRDGSSKKPICIPFPAYVAALVAGLDVDVGFADDNGIETQIHRSQPLPQSEWKRWLRTISFADYENDPSLDKFIESNVTRLRAIIEDGVCFGLAGVSTRPNSEDFSNVRTVGGLASQVQVDHSSNVFGFLDHKPVSAKRVAAGNKYSASTKAMAEWAAEQMKMLEAKSLDHLESASAPNGLAHFGIDPTPIARIPVNFESELLFPSIRELLTLLEKFDLAIFVSSFSETIETRASISQLAGHYLLSPVINGEFYDVRTENGLPRNPLSVLGCLRREAIARGKTPIMTTKERFGMSGLGMPFHLRIFSIRAEDKVVSPLMTVH
jgi:hypothetical protein